MSKKRKSRMNTSFYLFQCKNENLKRIIWFLFGIAVVLDIFVECKIFDAIESLLKIDIGLPIFLSEDYLNEVFAATCTVAVLGNAILSILFGVYDKKTLGVPFQDVLNHSVVGSEQKFTIEALTASIIFALAWYIRGSYNLLFSVLIIDVFLLLFSCEDLWKFLSDKQMQRKTITEIISEVDPSRYPVYVDNWFKDLDEALVPNNFQEAKEYFELIQLIIDTSPESADQVQMCVASHLQAYFNSACDKLGFSEALFLLREVIKYTPNDGTLDKHIAIKYFERMKSKDSVDIASFEASDVLKCIFQDDQIIEEDKLLYAYSYFCALFDNYQINSDAKNRNLNDILGYFCDLRDPDHGVYKAKIIMNIVKYRILDNDDILNRQKLFCSLIVALKQKNIISSKLYLQTISEIFRAFFFAIYLEKGSLTENYRTGLLSLFHTVTNDKDMIALSFMTLVEEQVDDVVSWLAIDSVSRGDKPRGFWDYLSLAMGWKKIVWTAEELISFAFCLCHTISNNFDARPFYNILESDEFTDEEKLFICKTLLDQYGCECFSDELVQKSQQLSEFWQFGFSIESSYWKLEHNYFQEKLVALESALNDSYLVGSKKCNSEIWSDLKTIFNGNSLFIYDPSVSLFPGQRITFHSSIEYLHKNFWATVPKRISDRMQEYFGVYLKEIFESMPINFQSTGVLALLSALEGNEYQYRNYRYTDDWGIKQNTRKTPEFKRLADILEHIPCDNSRRISSKVFIKKSKIPFNFQVRYDLRILSDRECEDYVSQQMKNGICNIGGYRFDFEHAKLYVKNNLLVENVTIFVHVSLQSEDGFIVDIQH